MDPLLKPWFLTGGLWLLGNGILEIPLGTELHDDDEVPGAAGCQPTIQKAIENGHRNSGCSHEKWWIFPC